jgi:hypothetical protein
MSEKQMFFSFLAFALCFGVIMVAIARVLSMRSSPVLVTGETNSRTQIDNDTFLAPEIQHFRRNHVKRPETKRALPVKTRNVKLDNTTPPVENNKPEQATEWGPIGIVRGYSARRLQDGRTEFRDSDGNVYLVGTDECFTLVGGEPRVLKSGVRYSREHYSLHKNGITIDLDPEAGELLLAQYMSLATAMDSAPDEKTRARYKSQLHALTEEYGILSGGSSSFKVSNTPVD